MMNAITIGLSRQTRRIAAAARGMDYVDEFKELGLCPNDLTKLDEENAATRIIEALQMLPALQQRRIENALWDYEATAVLTHFLTQRKIRKSEK